MSFGQGLGARAGQGPEHEAEHEQGNGCSERAERDATARVDELPALGAGFPDLDAPAVEAAARLPDDAGRRRGVPRFDEQVARGHADRVAGAQEVIVEVAASGQPDLAGLDAQRAALRSEVRGALIKEPGFLRIHHSSPSLPTPLSSMLRRGKSNEYGVDD